MDDHDLVARVRAGDLEAASQLLSKYQDAAYTVALRLLGNPSDAEDMAQEALVRAYSRITELAEGANFSGWLRRITVNLSLNALRRRGQLQMESLDGARDGQPHDDFSIATHATPEDVVIAQEFRAKVDSVLELMPADQRVAVVLRDMYAYDVAEIAALQKCGVSAAKMRILRGRTLLRRLLAEAHVSFGQAGD